MKISKRSQVDPFIVMDVMDQARNLEILGKNIIHMESSDELKLFLFALLDGSEMEPWAKLLTKRTRCSLNPSRIYRNIPNLLLQHHMLHFQDKFDLDKALEFSA